MNKKKIKTKILMSVSVIIIGFLISTSLLNIVSTQALLDTNENQNNLDSFDRTDWKWSTTEIVSTDSNSGSEYPSITIDATGNIHVAWEDYSIYAGSGPDRDIFYKRWDTTTSSWTPTEVVSTESTSTSYDPSLAVDTTGNLHIAWHDSTDYAGAGTDYDIFYKRWNASISSWTMTEVVSTESAGNSDYPSLAVDATGNVHIAWYDITDYAGSGTDHDIFYKRWNASTSLWTTTEVVSTESTTASEYPSLVVDAAGNVHVVWDDHTNYAGAGASWDIFYKCWNESTSLWTTTEVVSTESITGSNYPSMAVDAAGNIHVAWKDWNDYDSAGTDDDIFYKRWDTTTSTWTMTEVVSTESAGYSDHPSLVVDAEGNIHVTWTDFTDYADAGTDLDVFYKRWDASTSTWTTTEVVSTESTEVSRSPSIAPDAATYVHITWCDSTNYAGAGIDYDIFYKQFAGPPVVVPELAFIVPNPTELPTVHLDWNNVIRATSYHVYRSSSFIWSVEELNPITTISSSEYIDTVPSEGFYYYAIVATNFAGNSSHSNCQYVEVVLPGLDTPELAPILPNPTELDSVSLAWDDINGATEYHVYRSASYIWSVEGLTPIATVGSNSYVDSLPSEGYYFYVIVANDGVRNSTLSNCEYVEYKLPTLHEFFIISSLIIGLPILLFVVTRIRKKKSKMS